jgi:uncharacterized protein with HEPN domain
MRRDDAYLEDIRLAAKHIREFIGEMTMAEFLADGKTRAAVERNMITMGEAANRVSAELKDEHPTILWARLIQLRHIYVHGYDRLRPEEVWVTATWLAPAVERQIEEIIPPDEAD